MLVKTLLWTLLALNVAYIVFLGLGKAKRKSTPKIEENKEPILPEEVIEPPIEPPIVVRTIQPKPKEEEDNGWWDEKIVLPKQNRTTTRKQSRIDPDQQLLSDLEGDMFGN